MSLLHNILCFLTSFTYFIMSNRHGLLFHIFCLLANAAAFDSQPAIMTFTSRNIPYDFLPGTPPVHCNKFISCIV